MSNAATASPDPFDIREIRDRLEIENLILDHWQRVDRVCDRPVPELFCENGEMHIGQLVRLGRDDITSYYRGRRAQEDASGRKTRHIISNIVSERLDGGTIRARFLACVHAGVGEFPLPANPPSTIADFEADCRIENDAWRIATLRASVTFIGSGAPAFAQKD